MKIHSGLPAVWMSRRRDEEKLYCFLTEKDLLIPAGNILVKESYEVTRKPIYPVVSDCKDFLTAIEAARQSKAAKAIRHFGDKELEKIKADLEKEFDTVETHVVASPELKHHLFVVDDVEISVAPTMVYVRLKAPFSEHHYQSAQHNNLAEQ